MRHRERRPTPERTPLEMVDAALAAEEGEWEDRVRELAAEGERAADARRRRARADLLASLELGEVRRRARDGRMTAQDVEDWASARAERRAMLARLAGFVAGARLYGESVRVVETPSGPVAVATGGGGGGYRSSWNGGFYGYLDRERRGGGR